MTDEQVYEAIAQMCAQCELKMAGYVPVSARGVLRELGYDGDALEQVIDHIAAGGFTYCLDPRVAATHFDPNNPKAVNGMVTDYADSIGCMWGPDQLRSRLQCLSNVPYTYRHAASDRTIGGM